jgi:hypothetical protein
MFLRFPRVRALKESVKHATAFRIPDIHSLAGPTQQHEDVFRNRIDLCTSGKSQAGYAKRI